MNENYGYIPISFKINVTSATAYPFAHLEKLLNDNTEKDVILVIKGKDSFPDNKKILSDRSATFAKILKNSDVEKIEISDVNPETMKQLLLFIHTNKISKLFSLKNELLAAAKIYKLKEMETMCKKLIDANLPKQTTDSDEDSDSNKDSDSDKDSNSDEAESEQE